MPCSYTLSFNFKYSEQPEMKCHAMPCHVMTYQTLSSPPSPSPYHEERRRFGDARFPTIDDPHATIRALGICKGEREREKIKSDQYPLCRKTAETIGARNRFFSFSLRFWPFAFPFGRWARLIACIDGALLLGCRSSVSVESGGGWGNVFEGFCSRRWRVY